MKRQKTITVELAKVSKRKVENWMRRLMEDIRHSDEASAERLMRLMQKVSAECSRLDGEWAETIRKQRERDEGGESRPTTTEKGGKLSWPLN